MSRKALLVIDMLNDFVLKGAPLEVPKGREIVPALKKRIEEARREEIPVIYVCDSHDKDDEEFKVWPPHAISGTKGAEVIKELKPEEKDYIIRKPDSFGVRTLLFRCFLSRRGKRKRTFIIRKPDSFGVRTLLFRCFLSRRGKRKRTFIIKKQRYSGFFRTDLDNTLKKLGVRELIITGLVTNICVLYTAAAAVMRGYQVTVPKDSVAALNEEEGQFALNQMENVLKAKVV